MGRAGQWAQCAVLHSKLERAPGCRLPHIRLPYVARVITPHTLAALYLWAPKEPREGVGQVWPARGACVRLVWLCPGSPHGAQVRGAGLADSKGQPLTDCREAGLSKGQQQQARCCAIEGALQVLDLHTVEQQQQLGRQHSKQQQPLTRSATEQAMSSITIMSSVLRGLSSEPWYSVMFLHRHPASIVISCACAHRRRQGGGHGSRGTDGVREQLCVYVFSGSASRSSVG